MCRSTEQWAKVLPLSVYNNYLSTIKQQNTTNIITTVDLINFMKQNSDFRDKDRPLMCTFIRKYAYKHGYKHISERLIMSDCICRYKDGIEYHPHDLVDAQCTIDILMAGIYSVQTKIFLNLFVVPYYLSLHLEHMYVTSELGNVCTKIISRGFKSCACFKFNLVPATLYVWGMRAFFIIHRSINMLDQVELEMCHYFKRHKQLTASMLPQLIYRPRITRMKYFILQNATGIIRECLSTTAANSHVIIDDDGDSSDSFDISSDEIIEISDSDD